MGADHGRNACAFSSKIPVLKYYMLCFGSIETGLDITHHLSLLRTIWSSLAVFLLFPSFLDWLETAALYVSSVWRIQRPWLKSELQDCVSAWEGKKS